MSWITVIWSMNAGACLTLAAFYGAVWSKQREHRVYLLRCCTAVAATVISGFALWVLNATTVEQHQLLMRWMRVPVWAPFFLAITCTAVAAAMAYERSRDTARAARLTSQLEVIEKRFNVAADTANLGMWEWNLEKDEVWVSPARQAQLGFPASGRITFEQLISRWHEEDRDKVRQAVNDAIHQGRDYHGEFRVVRANGSMGWVCAHGRVQMDEHGKPKRLTGISLDITARKEAELLAQQQRNELERLTQQKIAFLERELAERARLEREVVERGAREQQQIAYNLHDGVGQQLVGIALSAKMLEEQLRPDRPAEAEKAAAIVRLANEAARQTRLTARILEGVDGVDDLKTALESLAMNISENYRVRSTVKASGAPLPVSAPVAAQLYRIAQEAVRNAVEHGAAREVLIQLTFGHQGMLLTVQDDGEGFDAKTIGHGMGLRIMRYRAQSVGGSCEVRAGARKGATVYCRVPLQAQSSTSMIS
jgi:PAS domain S-box-containing protein